MSVAFRLKAHYPYGMKPTVYIMTNGSRTVLYTGVTSNLELRVAQHMQGTASKFTQVYRVDRLVYFEEFQSMREALHRETVIKTRSRAGKIRLIESMNPQWIELSRT